MSTIQDLGLVVRPQGPVGPTGSSNIISQSITSSTPSLPSKTIQFDAEQPIVLYNIFYIDSDDFKEGYIPFSINKINSITFTNVIGASSIKSEGNVVYFEPDVSATEKASAQISLFMTYSSITSSTPIYYMNMILDSRNRIPGTLYAGTIRNLQISLDMLCYSQD